jgi:hypothetical protein
MAASHAHISCLLGPTKRFKGRMLTDAGKSQAFIQEKDGLIDFCERNYFQVVFGNYDGDLGCGFIYFSPLSRSVVDHGFILMGKQI